MAIKCDRMVWPVLVVLLAVAGLALPPGATRAQAPAPTAGAPSDVAAQEDEDDSFSEDISEQNQAAPRSPFSVGSIVGTYASTNIGRGGQFPVADVGVFKFDGTGTFSGSVNVNLPSGDFRTRIPDFKSSFTGTYTVNADGTGTTTTQFTLPGGATRETGSQFVITKAEVRYGQRIATEIKFVADNLSVTSGNLDVPILQKIPNGGFSNASLIGTYGFHTVGSGGAQPTADAGLTTFDGRGNTTVYFNQNIPGGKKIPGFPAPAFFQRQVFSSSVDLTYDVNPDGTGKSNVAHFIITKAKKIGNQLVATEVFFIADALDPFSGNLQTTILTRLSGIPNPRQGGYSLASLDGTYGGKVIGRGGQTQQITAVTLTFDGAGKFDGSGVINLPGQLYGQRIFQSAPFVGTYTVQRNGFGTALNGGESYFVITASKAINGVKVATEFALVVKELQPTGNLITAIFTRLPDQGEFSVASLRGTYATTVLGEGGFQPEAGIGTITFDGAGGAASSFKENIPGNTFNERQVFSGNTTGTYTLDETGIGTTSFIGMETVFVVTKARVTNGIKEVEEYFLIAKDLSPYSRSIVTSVGTRLSR